jgi:hypothetical protein
MNKQITISSKSIAVGLLSIILFLLTANLLIIYLQFILGFEHLKGFIHGFYFDAEANFPSLYSAGAILFAALMLWLIGSSDDEKRNKRSFYWKFISIVFVFLAMDEFGSIHEYLISPTQKLVDQSSIESDYLYFAWFIPYSLLFLVVAIVSLRFLFKLPPRTRNLLIVSGIVFLAGAVLMEMIGGKYWAEQGWAVDGSDDVDLTYALIITIEELLEMLGIVIFIYALTTYYLKGKRDRAFLVTISDTTGSRLP